MGFFTKACVQALKDIPAANAEIDGTDLIYKNYYHVGIAVGTDKGLVVPVVRDCDQKSISDIEKGIADFGRRARDGQLKIDEMQGGTFTITNGGIYGSLMSTPILNAPQSAILGMTSCSIRGSLRWTEAVPADKCPWTTSREIFGDGGTGIRRGGARSDRPRTAVRYRYRYKSASSKARRGRAIPE